MEAFFILIVKIIPLYFLILLGFIAGRFLKVPKEPIAAILIYILTPLVLFHAVLTVKFQPAFALLPIIFFVVCSLISILFYKATKGVFADSTRNLLGLAAGIGNTAYFGYPLVIALFGQAGLSIAVIADLGVFIFVNSLGFFIVARGNYSLKESLTSFLRLPGIYAFFLALFLNLAGFNGFASNPVYAGMANNFIGAFSVLGMMMVGLALSELKSFIFKPIDAKFLFLAFLAKFLVWPIVIVMLIVADMYVFKAFSPDIYKVAFIFSIVPLGITNVIYAALLKVHPEKASQAVFLSTVFALFYIPLMLYVFNF